MVSKQVVWAAEMFQKAFPHKSFPVDLPGGRTRNVLHLRGCHYWIVTHPGPEQMIPGVGGKLREYKNTTGEFRNLSEILVKARIAGLVDPDDFSDQRNSPLIPGGRKQKFAIDYHHYHVNSGSYLNTSVDSIKEWDDFVKGIYVSTHFKKSRFHNQMYEVVVVTEKATVEAIIKDICLAYGANCLAVTGQSSVTRVYDAVKIAKAHKRPILLLGLYDLDCAGWDMGPAFMNRIQDIYPHKDHKFVRVCLLRNQAEVLSLPTSFDASDKEYPQKQIDRFERETGGSDCIELDALDNSFIRAELRSALEKYMRPAADKFQNRRLTKKELKRVTVIVDEEFDYTSYQDEYEHAYEKYMKFYSRAQRILKVLTTHYDSVARDLYGVEQVIKNALIVEVDGVNEKE